MISNIPDTEQNHRTKLSNWAQLNLLSADLTLKTWFLDVDSQRSMFNAQMSSVRNVYEILRTIEFGKGRKPFLFTNRLCA